MRSGGWRSEGLNEGLSMSGLGWSERPLSPSQARTELGLLMSRDSRSTATMAIRVNAWKDHIHKSLSSAAFTYLSQALKQYVKRSRPAEDANAQVIIGTAAIAIELL